MKYLDDVLASGQLTSSHIDGGKYVQKLERVIRDYTGARYCVVVNSGTSALMATIIAMGITGNIAFPSLTFRATRNAIIASRCNPIGIDVRLDDMTIETPTIETDAIIPVHLYGHVAHMGKLLELDIPIIEDCAQALGSKLNNKHVGRFGDAGCFSFYPSKIITGGEGGAVITDKKYIVDRLKLFRNNGDENNWGLNLRMSEIHASIALTNMENLDNILRDRKEIATIWDEKLQDVKKYYPRMGETRNHQLFTITTEQRKELMIKHPDARIYYDYTLGDGENATFFSEQVLSFPTAP